MKCGSLPTLHGNICLPCLYNSLATLHICCYISGKQKSEQFCPLVASSSKPPISKALQAAQPPRHGRSEGATLVCPIHVVTSVQHSEAVNLYAVFRGVCAVAFSLSTSLSTSQRSFICVCMCVCVSHLPLKQNSIESHWSVLDFGRFEHSPFQSVFLWLSKILHLCTSSRVYF